MADLLLFGFLTLLAGMAWPQVRAVYERVCRDRGASAPATAEGDGSDFDDIAWDWFPERKAS